MSSPYYLQKRVELIMYDASITIRELKPGDGAALAAALNNVKVQANLRDGLPYPYTAADGEDYISSVVTTGDGSQFVRVICLDGKVIGNIGVFRKENIHRLTAEMGYYIGEEYWGRGIVAEAVKLHCAYIFEHTDILRIFAEPYAYNRASCRVLEKAGFTHEGTLRRNAIKNGIILDMELYARLK